MECICKNCIHWNNSSQILDNRVNKGECERLSHITPSSEPEFVQPVTESGEPIQNAKEIEIITMAHFGCNQFSVAA